MSLNLFFGLLFISLFNYKCCWVMNDIDWQRLYEMEKLNDDYNLFEDDDEIAPEDLMRMKFSLIYPGTKWCGAGNNAENYDDLGTSVEADRCCRDHDHCEDLMLSGETKNNLTNKSYYTRLSCACDEKFRLCLREANTTTANRIGKMYFNVIGTSCYRQDYLVTGCLKKGGWLRTKCLEYSYDKSSELIYQWFNVPNY